MAVLLLIISLLFSFTVYDHAYAQDTSDTEIVAEVNGEKITVKDFEETLEVSKIKLERVLDRDLKMQLLNTMIDKVLLYEEALTRKLDEQPDIKTEIERAKRNILVKALLKTEISDKITYTEEELKEYYEKHIEKYEPTVVTAHMIIISKVNRDGMPVGSEAEKCAQKIKERLMKGEEPQDIVAEYSDKDNLIVLDKSFFNKDKRQFSGSDETFLEQVFQAELGTTFVLTVEQSINVVKVLSKEKFSSFDLEKNKAIVDLEYELRSSLYESLVSKLREKAQITINNEMVR
jgi:EpsD family peptidyl-prolyl cis-trans isomerase